MALNYPKAAEVRCESDGLGGDPNHAGDIGGCLQSHPRGVQDLRVGFWDLECDCGPSQG